MALFKMVRLLLSKLKDQDLQTIKKLETYEDLRDVISKTG